MIIQSNIENQILRTLDGSVFAEIAKHLEFIDLPRKFALSEPDEPSLYVYFLESGIGSIVAISSEGYRAEVGLFGRDGMSPTATGLDGETSPFAIFMQVSGAGHRIKSAILMAMLEKNAPLRKLLSRYAQSMSVQTAYTALSNGVHHIEERLARWILMCHDRTDGNEIALTHEFLSIMLAVRRPSVTTALHVLEGNGFILAERGRITIRNRAALQAFASDAYGIPEREHRRLIGPTQ